MNLPAWMTSGEYADGGAPTAVGAAAEAPPPPSLGQPIVPPPPAAAGLGAPPPPPFALPAQAPAYHNIHMPAPPVPAHAPSHKRERTVEAGPTPSRSRIQEPSGYQWRPRLETGKGASFDVGSVPGMEPPALQITVNTNELRGHTGPAPPPRGAYGGPSAAAGAGGRLDTNPSTRHARRVYIGNLPRNSRDADIATFVSATLDAAVPAGCPAHRRGDQCVLSARMVADKQFGFVELGSVELTTAALTLDGAEYVAPGGARMFVRVKRPNDYRPEAVTSGPVPLLNLHMLVRATPETLNGFSGSGGGGDSGGGGPRVFIGGLPRNLGEADVEQLLLAFGPINDFKLVREPGALENKGYGFCEYVDQATTDAAIAGLHGIEIGAKTLTVKLATGGSAAPAAAPAPAYMHQQQPPPPQQGYGHAPAPPAPYGGVGGVTYQAYNQFQPTPAPASYAAAPPVQHGYTTATGAAPPAAAGDAPTCVLKMSNMVTLEELRDDAEWADIRDDVQAECTSHGPVVRVIIPRVREGFSPSSEGLIFVRFAEVAGAMAAEAALQGRKFADRVVVSEYYSESLFENGIL